jgi:glucose-1-phosphate cytidylyltransferase
VREPFQRLVGERRLTAYEYDGFWMSMDTFKDRQQLEDIYSRGDAPWEVWNKGSVAAPASYAGVAV